MTVDVERMAATIGLETTCQEECNPYSLKLFTQMASGSYEWPMSVLPLDEPWPDWFDRLRTAKKRIRVCRALRYTTSRFERLGREREIHAINTSLERRQGRRMADGYWLEPTYGPEKWACPRHRVTCYGTFDPRGVLVAYCFLYRCGELALVSQILGHGEHLRRHVMFPLLSRVYREEQQHGGYLVYNRHDSGTDGLRQFKEWFRFQATHVTWAP